MWYSNKVLTIQLYYFIKVILSWNGKKNIYKKKRNYLEILKNQDPNILNTKKKSLKWKDFVNGKKEERKTIHACMV